MKTNSSVAQAAKKAAGKSAKAGGGGADRLPHRAPDSRTRDGDEFPPAREGARRPVRLIWCAEFPSDYRRRALAAMVPNVTQARNEERIRLWLDRGTISRAVADQSLAPEDREFFAGLAETIRQWGEPAQLGPA